MKYYLSLVLCISIFFNVSAQFSDIKIVTEQELNVPRFVVTGDMNNDGRDDIIIPSNRSIFINYNLPNEDFSTFIEPVINLGAPQTIYVSDLNGNGFLDILGTDFDVANENFWVPNNGDGTFGDKITIYTGARPYHIFAADIDGDGDNDVLTNSAAEAELRLFKNLDGLGTFDTGTNINVGNANGRSTRVADFDGDGDLDVASSGSGGTQLTWFENMDGQGSSWGTHLVQGAGNGLESIAVADFDGDGDIDLLKGEYIGNLAWHENIDGLGNFGKARIIAPELEFMASVFAADLDNDGDIDVMATHDNAASYWLNIDGQGNFGSQNNLHEGLMFPRGIHAADLNNDGDQDIVVVSQNDNAAYWFENLTILGISKNFLQHIKIYPNPAGDTLLIKSKTSIEYTVTIQDVLGRIILEDTNNPKSLDISQLASGPFFVTIRSGKSKKVEKIVKK